MLPACDIRQVEPDAHRTDEIEKGLGVSSFDRSFYYRPTIFLIPFNISSYVSFVFPRPSLSVNSFFTCSSPIILASTIIVDEFPSDKLSAKGTPREGSKSSNLERGFTMGDRLKIPRTDARQRFPRTFPQAEIASTLQPVPAAKKPVRQSFFLIEHIRFSLSDPISRWLSSS